jgi:uncharacterized membrane protein
VLFTECLYAECRHKFVIKSVIMVSAFMQSAECCCSDCFYAECRHKFIIKSVVMLIVVVLSVTISLVLRVSLC